MRTLLIAVVVFLSSSCTDTDWARHQARGQSATIELYSGGKIVASFESTGIVQCTEGGICDFMDAKTGKLVRTTGDIVVRVK